MKPARSDGRRQTSIFLWTIFGILVIAGLGYATTIGTDAGIITTGTINSTGYKMTYARPQVSSIVARPLFSTRSLNVTVCSSGCNYTSIQAALNEVPLILNHKYIITVLDGTYNENLLVPATIISDVTDAVDGACIALELRGNTSNRNAVRVNSIEVAGGVGCQNPWIHHFTLMGYDPNSDENVSIAVYGTNHAAINNNNFTGVSANYGVLAYGSFVTLTDNDFGNNNLNYAVTAKHGGILSFNDGPSNRGTVKLNLAELDDGVIYLNNDSMGMGYTGDMFSYTSDHSGVSMSRDLTNKKTILHQVNYFQEPIKPQNTGASSNGLVAYYKADTLYDYSGNGNNVSALNSATTSAGRFGQSFTSDGTNKVWSANNTVLKSDLTTFSFFGWAKIVGDGVTNQVIFRTGSTGAQTAGLYFDADGSDLICAITLNGTTYSTAVATGENIRQWNQYGCVYNASDLVYYVNGKYLSKVDTIDNGALNLSTSLFAINARSNAGSHNFNGSTDEIMIFNRTLSAEEMRSWYEKGTEGISADAYYLKRSCTWEGNTTQGAICSDSKVMRGMNITSQQILCC